MINRYMAWFEKSPGESFIGKEDLTDITLSELQRIFSVQTDNPMYDCWPVRRKHIRLLQKHVRHLIDLTMYDYFIEAEEINAQQPASADGVPPSAES
jgi:hypothetical protein